MSRYRPSEGRRVINGPLIQRVQRALGVTQEELSNLLRTSRRNIVRWQSGERGPPQNDLVTLVARVYAENPRLGVEVATACGTTVEALGVVRPAPAPPPLAPSRPAAATPHLVDSVVCAAAEAVALSPQAIRPAVLAALERASALGLAVDEMRDALRPNAPVHTASATRRG